MTRPRGRRRRVLLAGGLVALGISWLVALGCDSRAEIPRNADRSRSHAGIWISREEIRASFADGWTVVSIEPAVIETTVPKLDAIAWHATIEAI